MKILYITTDENKNLHVPDRKQGDCIENGILLGLREILGSNCVDYPRKKILYHDWSEVSKDSLHGKGFSIYHKKMKEIPDDYRDLSNQSFDVMLYGTSPALNNPRLPDLEKKSKYVFYVDSNDLYGVADEGVYITYNNEKLIGNQYSPSFKREIILAEPHIYPTGIGIPESRILNIDLNKKIQLYQKAYPRYALFEPVNETNRNHYIFTDEEKYYEDMASSWFGLTCKRGGWDAIRHYEIMAAGAVLLYRDYHMKPPLCAPGDLPAPSYSSKEELFSIMNSLVINNIPTDNYIKLLNKQRDWLIKNATVRARAQYIINVLQRYLDGDITYGKK